jgi:hypothetical protein
LIQCFDRLERYVEPRRFDTIEAAEPAGPLIDDLAVADVAVVEGDTRMRTAQ